jgi:hypothetical protein
MLDDDYVRIQLRLCGCTTEEIQTFIGAYRVQ